MTVVGSKPSTTINGHLPGKHAASDWSDPFVPDVVYDALKRNDTFEAMRQGQQEDAQEFLSAFLNALHDELLALIDRQTRANGPPAQPNGVVPKPAAASAGGDDDWLEMGPGGRAATTRSVRRATLSKPTMQTDQRDSAVTRIFSGKMRSVLRVANKKDSATIEPFQLLQLDIDVRTHCLIRS